MKIKANKILPTIQIAHGHALHCVTSEKVLLEPARRILHQLQCSPAPRVVETRITTNLKSISGPEVDFRRTFPIHSGTVHFLGPESDREAFSWL
jgi:hypothetical protein